MLPIIAFPIDPIKLWADRSGRLPIGCRDSSMRAKRASSSSYKANNPNAHNFDVLRRRLNLKCDQWSETTTKNAGGAGIYIVADLANTLGKRENADLRYNTAAVQLERNDEVA